MRKYLNIVYALTTANIITSELAKSFRLSVTGSKLYEQLFGLYDTIRLVLLIPVLVTSREL